MKSTEPPYDHESASETYAFLQHLHGMVDASKYADLVLLMVDGAFGFEMETFEFLNLLQVQGFPKIMGVLTHLDGFKDATKLKATKKALKHRFWEEIYQGRSSKSRARSQIHIAFQVFGQSLNLMQCLVHNHRAEMYMTVLSN